MKDPSQFTYHRAWNNLLLWPLWPENERSKPVYLPQSMNQPAAVATLTREWKIQASLPTTEHETTCCCGHFDQRMKDPSQFTYHRAWTNLLLWPLWPENERSKPVYLPQSMNQPAAVATLTREWKIQASLPTTEHEPTCCCGHFDQRMKDPSQFTYHRAWNNLLLWPLTCHTLCYFKLCLIFYFFIQYCFVLCGKLRWPYLGEAQQSQEWCSTHS